MNTRADSQNNNKLTNHCLQRETGWLGLDTIAERTKIRQECIPLFLWRPFPAVRFKKWQKAKSAFWTWAPVWKEKEWSPILGRRAETLSVIQRIVWVLINQNSWVFAPQRIWSRDEENLRDWQKKGKRSPPRRGALAGITPFNWLVLRG